MSGGGPPMMGGRGGPGGFSGRGGPSSGGSRGGILLQQRPRLLLKPLARPARQRLQHEFRQPLRPRPPGHPRRALLHPRQLRPRRPPLLPHRADGGEGVLRAEPLRLRGRRTPQHPQAHQQRAHVFLLQLLRHPRAQSLPRHLDAAHAARARRRFLAVAHPRRRAGLRPHRPASLPRQRDSRQPPEPGGPRPAPLHAAAEPAGQRAELSVRGLHRQRHG